MLRSNRVQILRKWRRDVTSAYRVFAMFLHCHKQCWYRAEVDRNWELLGNFSNFWLAATSPTCVAKVTYILVLAKTILLLATGCQNDNVHLWYIKSWKEYIDIWTFYDQIPRTSRTTLVGQWHLEDYFIYERHYLGLWVSMTQCITSK